MKWFSFFLLLCSSSIAFSLPTTLFPGDIAIIGFNFKNPDQFSFITFKDLEAGTIIYFTDCGWQNNGLFRKGEGLITYTVPAGGKNAYDLITYPTDAGFITQGISGFFGLAVNGDQLLAFQGSFNLPNFIFALTTYNKAWQSDAVDNNSTSLPTSLASSHAFIAFDLTVNGGFQCNTNTHLNLESIVNISNWSTSDERVDLPGTCFNSNLPITIYNFQLQKLNDETKASATVTVEGITEIDLQESEDGISFNNIESRYIHQGTSTIIFNTPLSANYYRLIVKENQRTIYSTVLSKESFIEEKMISTTVYNLQGEILECVNGSIKTELNYLKNKFHQPVIIKEINSVGKIIIRKYLFQP